MSDLCEVYLAVRDSGCLDSLSASVFRKRESHMILTSLLFAEALHHLWLRHAGWPSLISIMSILSRRCLDPVGFGLSERTSARWLGVFNQPLETERPFFPSF